MQRYKMTDCELPFDLVIRSKSGLLDFGFSDLFQYGDLIFMLFRRNITLQYKQTALGMMWLFLYPLLTSFVFTFVFGQFAGLSTGGIPQFLFYLINNSVWWVCANCVSNASRTFQADAAMFQKVYFPRLAAPLAQLLTGLFSFAIRFLMILAAFFIFYFQGGDMHISWNWLLLPVLIVQAGLLGMAIGIIISSMATKYRDMVMVADFGVTLWMYATPVVYAFSSTGGWMRTILWINPMTSIVENFRYCFTGVGSFMAGSWIVSWVWTVVLLLFGVVYFGNTSKSCVDTL